MHNNTAKMSVRGLALVAALTVAGSLCMATGALAASSIVDMGYVNDGLIGRTLYNWEPSGPNDPVYVLAVDPAREQVFVLWKDSSKSWTPAANLYTKDQSDLANQQWNSGLGAVARLGFALLSGDGSDAASD